MAYDLEQLAALLSNVHCPLPWTGLWCPHASDSELLKAAVNALPAMLADLRDMREMREMLRQQEWILRVPEKLHDGCPECGVKGITYRRCCPRCKNPKSEGHAADCALDRLVNGGVYNG